MGSGGARTRSGPAPDPSSGRSDARGYSLKALPAEGYTGQVPAFPLPRRSVYFQTFEDNRPVRAFDEQATQDVVDREQELWEWAWSTPQACAWSMPSERWRWHTVAMWVRTAVICESSEAKAADKSALHRFADQIGLTTAGLAAMGWTVAVDELGERAANRNPATSSSTEASEENAAAASRPTSRPRRLRAVGDQ